MMRALLLAAALVVAVPAATSAQQAPPAVTAQDRIIGRADAPVTVIEYASFTCSHCGDWHRTVWPAFKARYVDTGKARLVFRDLPTDPVQVSASAAGVSICAAPENAEQVIAAFMGGQAALLDGGPQEAWFGAAVAASGRTEDQIRDCLRDPATMARLRAGVEGAVAAGVQGTPSFFVNGRRVEDSSLTGLSAAIDPLLRAR